jgi:hypothetical protein
MMEFIPAKRRGRGEGRGEREREHGGVKHIMSNVSIVLWANLFHSCDSPGYLNGDLFQKLKASIMM